MRLNTFICWFSHLHLFFCEVSLHTLCLFSIRLMSFLKNWFAFILHKWKKLSLFCICSKYFTQFVIYFGFICNFFVVIWKLPLFFFFFFTTPEARGSSQARDWTLPTAVTGADAVKTTGPYLFATRKLPEVRAFFPLFLGSHLHHMFPG